MFAGPWGQTSFAVFLGCLMLVILVLFMRFSTGYSITQAPFLWLLTVITFLYLFQYNGRIWYSIASGMNYLFPILPSLTILLILQHIETSKFWNSNIGRFCLVLIGLIAGWCQECYSVPLSGGLFIYILFNFRKIHTNTWILAVALWIGTAILVFAPGNFIRLGQKRSLIISIINGFRFLYGTVLFWLFIVTSIIVRIWRKDLFKTFVADNKLGLLILAVAISFGLVANSLPQSFNGISFFSAILLFRLLSLIPCLAQNNIRTLFVTSAIALLLIAHQYRILNTTRMLQSINHSFVQAYIDSPDGIMEMPQINLPTDVQPFVSTWFTNQTAWWIYYTIELHHTHGEKHLTVLTPADFAIYTHEPFSISNRETTANNTDFVIGDQYLWYDGRKLKKDDTLTITYAPDKAVQNPGILRKIKRKLFPYQVPAEKVISVNDSTCIMTKSTIIGIPIDSNRKISKLTIN